MTFIIYTERILENGATHRENYTCKSYSQSEGILGFFGMDDNNKHWFISIHKMDSVMIQIVNDENNKEENENEVIRCLT